jgi:hypothetical protein
MDHLESRIRKLEERIMDIESAMERHVCDESLELEARVRNYLNNLEKDYFENVEKPVVLEQIPENIQDKFTKTELRSLLDVMKTADKDVRTFLKEVRYFFFYTSGGFEHVEAVEWFRGFLKQRIGIDF